ncbi:ATP-binding cassette sub- A member 5 [Bulinus truncatus]|nr:ATP-binding cassette sub- A member 5 [Bulinus truncatus]
MFSMALVTSDTCDLHASSLAIADLAVLIFLDEPTAGMDPYSRRHLWSLLKKKKEGRVVLLTTHFMDEADILADRKAFMSKGKLRCCGSSLFLKNKFGIGYHLTMVITPECEIEKVTELLQLKISDIELQRSYGKELSYIIPLKDVSQFSTLFSDLDEQSKKLGIDNYGVSMTTLEEVFLKLESEEVNDNENAEANEDNNVMFAVNSEHSNIEPPTPIQTFSSLAQSVVKGKSLSKQRFKNLLQIRYLLVRRNLQALIFQIFLPITFVVIGLVLAKVNRAAPAEYPKPLEINPQLYVDSLNTSSKLLPLLAFDAVNTTDSIRLIDEWKHHYKVDIYKAGANTSGQVAPHYMGIEVQNITGQNFNKFVILYNDSALHSVPAAINLFSQTMLSLYNATKSIIVNNLPWPQIDSVILFNSGALMAPLLVGLAFMLIIPGFAADIVQDREWKLRGQLRISGVTFNEYWASIYAFDVVLYMIPSILVLIVVLAMQIEGLSSPGAVGSLVLLFVINMPFYIVLALVLSFIFDKTESCISYLPQILTIVAMLPYITVSLVDMISRSNAAIIIHYVACILDPPYIMFGGFYFISRPVIHFIWMYWLLRVLDIKKTGGKIREAFPCIPKSEDGFEKKNTDIAEDEDDDVIAERARIENLHSFENPSYSRQANHSLLEVKPPVAYTQQLRKVYHKRSKKAQCFQSGHVKSKIAVKNLTFGVYEGEVLGLLGPNGAGKTTALNMIIAETEPTCGKVIVSNYNVRSHMLSVLEFLGYCPQHDALWENITLEEHIRCFAAIKGVDPKHLDAVVDFYVSSLKLHDHKKKLAKKLSGGTKRKLSYIISILGSPRLVLLDEPSTGMDPQSKRFLWDTISASFKKTDKGAILTTHYMEEADALCDRVGIMVNGQLVCLGSTQHLKSKFGSGYILEVKLRCSESSLIESLMDRLEEHLRTVFTGLEKVERFLERAQYAIPREDVKSLGETFAILEKCKETHNLEEYNFSQSTLEQVFLHFAKKQLDEEDDDGHQNSNYNILTNV